MERELKVRETVVIYIDERRRETPALLTAVWGEPRHFESEEGPKTDYPCVNLVFVSMDPDCQDSYGRQIARDTSCVHWTNSSAIGCCWRFMDEVVDMSKIQKPQL